MPALLKARGLREKKELVLKRNTCLPEKHRMKISTILSDRLSAND